MLEWNSNPPSASVLKPDMLSRICVKKCRTDLQTLRSKIVATCKPTDLMVLDKKSFPRKYLAWP